MRSLKYMSSEAPAEEQADTQPAEPTVATPTGPRGGTTTVTESGMVKKNLWVPGEMAERLRRAAYEERVSEAHIMRRGLALVLEVLE